jgi:hypothetical protein
LAPVSDIHFIPKYASQWKAARSPDRTRPRMLPLWRLRKPILKERLISTTKVKCHEIVPLFRQQKKSRGKRLSR